MMSFSAVEWMNEWMDGWMDDDDDNERVSPAPTRRFFWEPPVPVVNKKTGLVSFGSIAVFWRTWLQDIKISMIKRISFQKLNTPRLS